jgi:hypothetical protein
VFTGYFFENSLGLFRPHLLLRVITGSLLVGVHDNVIYSQGYSFIAVVYATTLTTLLNAGAQFLYTVESRLGVLNFSVLFQLVFM